MNRQIKDYEDIVFDTKILGYIVDIVDEASLTRAAGKNYLSQPALSRYLHDLEQSIGISIFIKRHNRLELTKEGILFINGARSMLHFEQEALDKIHLSLKSSTESIRIAAPYILKKRLHSLALRWNADHPKAPVTLMIENADTVEKSLAGKECEFGIILDADGNSNGYHGSFSCAPLQKTSLVLFIPADAVASPGGNSDYLSLQDLRNERFMLCTHDTFLRRAQKKLLAEAGIQQPNIAAEADADLLAQLVKAGIGNVILPAEYASLADKKRIVPLPEANPCHYSLIWNKNTKQNYRNNFISFLKDSWPS